MTIETFSVGDKSIGPGAPAFVIAEIAQAHDGSLGLAHAFIDAAAECGADAVKFQTHIAREESTLDEPFRVKFSRQDETRFAYWKRMEFTREQWSELAIHAEGKGLVFLSSPFSLAAVAMLADIGMAAWKIASGELGSLALQEAMIATGAPLLVSSGMSSWSEIDELAKKLTHCGSHFAVLQCTSQYPTPLSDVGLNVIDEMRQRYGRPVGLSDHSGLVFPALAAMARGANVVELHLTLDRRMFGPDVPASLTVPELRLVCEARDAIFTMDSHPVDKNEMADKLVALRDMFQRSLALREAYGAGTVLTAEMLAVKKPGTGIPEGRLQDVIGRKLAKPVDPERLLAWSDLE